MKHEHEHEHGHEHDPKPPADPPIKPMDAGEGDDGEGANDPPPKLPPDT